MPGFLPLQEETALPQWQRWVGCRDPISHDTFGYVSQRMDPAQWRAAGAWINRYNALGNDEDGASAIALDRNGNVFVTGYSWSGSSRDFVTIKYSSSVPPPRLDFQKLNNALVLN